MGEFWKQSFHLFSILKRMIKKNFITIFIFILSGELLIRFDESFRIMEASRVIKIETSMAITPEFELLKNYRINTVDHNYRIMVLGDSYIHGGGIELKDNFSQQLKILLKAGNYKYEEVYVLDVSKPSSNNFDNIQTYHQFSGKFKPQVLILGYNYNDILGNLDKEIVMTQIDSFKNVQTSTQEKQTFIKKVYDILYQSKFINFVLHNLHDEMKAHGIVMAKSSFGLMLSDYQKNNENWMKSKQLLTGMITDAKKNGVQVYVLKFPEINLLSYPELFSAADTAISGFFNNMDIHFIDGAEIFKGEKTEDNILSKYDGHPNERAHHIMADYVYKMIISQNPAFSK
jgi:hypothetical protein